MAATILPSTPTSVVSSAAADCSTPSIMSADLTTSHHHTGSAKGHTTVRSSQIYHDAVNGPNEPLLMGTQSSSPYPQSNGHSSNKLLHSVPVASSQSKLSSSTHATIGGSSLQRGGSDANTLPIDVHPSSRYPLNTSGQYSSTHDAAANEPSGGNIKGLGGSVNDNSMSSLSLWGAYPTPLHQQPSPHATGPHYYSNTHGKGGIQKWASAVFDHSSGGSGGVLNPRHLLTKAVATPVDDTQDRVRRPYATVREQNSNTPVFLRHSYSKSSVSRQSSFRHQRVPAHSHSHLPAQRGSPSGIWPRAGSPKGKSMSVSGGIFGGLSASNKMDVVSLSLRTSPAAGAARSPARQKSFSNTKGAEPWGGLRGVTVTTSTNVSSASGLFGVSQQVQISEENVRAETPVNNENEEDCSAQNVVVRESVLNAVRNRPSMMLTVFLQDLYGMLAMSDINANSGSARRQTNSPSQFQLSQHPPNHFNVADLYMEGNGAAAEVMPIHPDFSCDLGRCSPSAMIGLRASSDSPELARPPSNGLPPRPSIPSGNGQYEEDGEEDEGAYAADHEPPLQSSVSLQQMLGSCFSSSQRILTQPSEPLIPQVHSDGVTRCVDNEEGNLVMYVGMVLLGWLEVVSELGSGSFGQVVLCKDLRTTANAASLYQKERDYKYYYTSPEYCDIEGSEGSLVAVKVFSSNPTCESQSYIEAQIMQDLMARQQQEEEVDEEGNPVEYEEQIDPRKSFVCQILASGASYGHHCIAMRRYACNLYEYLVSASMDGLPISVVRHIAHQSLLALSMVHEKGFVHCDIKPENIMVKCDTDVNAQVPYAAAGNEDKSQSDGLSPLPMQTDNTPPPVEVAVIDFSSSCDTQPASYFEYIQSRYYRAPEAIIAAPYSTPMDIWSLGCVLAEILIGRPLLPGANNFHQLNRIIEMFGPLPSWLLDQGTNTGAYYHINRPAHQHESPGGVSEKGTTQQYFADPEVDEQVLGVGGDEESDVPAQEAEDPTHLDIFDASLAARVQGHGRMDISSTTPIYANMATASATPANVIPSKRPSVVTVEGFLGHTPADSNPSPIALREQTTEYFSSGFGFPNGSCLHDNHSFATTDPLSPANQQLPTESSSCPPSESKIRSSQHILASTEGTPSEVPTPTAPSHVILTEEEFCAMHGCEPAPWLRYLKYDTLQEIIQHLRLSEEEQQLPRRALVQQRKVLYQFLKGMLQVDPSKRLTADELLAHPFITQQYGGISETPTKGSATRSSGGLGD